MDDRDSPERSDSGAYEPPTIVTLGSVDEFTAGDAGTDSGTLDGV